MSDWVAVTPGSGANVAADLISGTHHQRVKVQHGADGSAVDTSAVNPLPVADDQAEHLLSQLLALAMSPRGYDRSLGRARGTVVVESGTVTTVSTVTTVTTVSSVANIAAIGGYSAQMQVLDTNRTSWASTVRNLIT